MQPARRLRILHLSDLHIGKEQTENAWRVERVMGDAWTQNLREIGQSGKIDLICFTGDLAQSGKSTQYQQISRTIESLCESLEVPLDRFFCVPGNHDVDRDIAPEAWDKLREAQFADSQGLSRWMVGAKPPFGWDETWRDAVLARQQCYRDWLDAIGLAHLHPQRSPHGRLGYRVSLDIGLEAPLHIVGFDSAWLAGNDADASKLRLTDDQIGRLMTGDDGKRLSGWSIGLIHHPLTDLADARDAQRLLGDYGLGLLLHGHQHDANIETWADPQRTLPVLAAGCLYEHHRYPNGLLVIDVELPAAQSLRPLQAWARTWSPRGFWHDDNGLYRGANNGRLRLAPETSEPLRLTPGHFIGRSDELDALRKALLPDDSAARKPTVVCCAIEGMPGVGKTRLAEEFVQRHWLPALVLPADADPAAHVLRVALAHDDRRSALDLGSTLADMLRSPGPSDSLWQRLRPQLLEGPYRKPRLVLIENVDDAPQARAVAELVGHLPGCAILVTARHRQIGDAGWARVGVAPLPLGEAAELLRSEAAAAGEGAYVPDQPEAEALANALGCLPLALHIAASHLGLGHTPKSFLDALRDEGLDLAPANPGDHGLSVDRARAILRSSFDLSWKTWCAGAGSNVAWQQALVALAHGPAAGVGDALGAAIAALDGKQYVDCVIAAKRLSLLEFQFEGEGEARERRTSLHPLIAEFLRSQPAPDAQTVIERMGAWFGPRVSDHDHDTMGESRRQVQAEEPGLVAWLAQTDLPQQHISIVSSVKYATACGPFGAWLGCFRRCLASVDDDKRRLDLAWAVTRLAQFSGDPDLGLRTARDYAALAHALENDREHAVAQGQIADILQARGQLDEALRIRREEQMPVYERLGDVRSLAITQGKIADILEARGQLDEALRIRREEQMPVYERLGDVRSLLVGRANLAITLAQRGLAEDRVEIHTLLHQASAAAEQMRLPEADTIRGLIAQIFGPNSHEAP
jgi:Calcineurin-like phosphoesterase